VQIGRLVMKVEKVRPRGVNKASPFGAGSLRLQPADPTVNKLNEMIVL